MLHPIAGFLAVFLCLFELCLLASPCRAESPYEEVRGRAMGTTYSVKVGARPETVPLDTLAADVRGELERIEQVFLCFEPTQN